MKNKFKKSKIIVPALALITATTVASVTGTVAWFTASRVATASTSKFDAVALDSALNVVSESGIGTTGDDTASSTNTVTVDGNLTHGSYDAKAISTDDTNNGHLYVANLNGDDTTAVVTSYTDLGTISSEITGEGTNTQHAWKAGTKGNQSVWYGISWTLKFSQTNNNATNEDNYLLFDPSSTTFSQKDESGLTIKGLRVALMTSSKFLVVAGDDTNTHIDSTTEVETTKLPAFDKGNFVKVGTSVNKINDYAVNGTGETGKSVADSKYTFGVIPATANSTIDITCVAWFEGTDENVESTKMLSTQVVASLKFYSRKAKRTTSA